MSSQCWEEDLLLPHVSLMWETWVEVRPCCSLPRFHWSLQDKEELCDGLVGGGGKNVIEPFPFLSLFLCLWMLFLYLSACRDGTSVWSIAGQGFVFTQLQRPKEWTSPLN